MELKARPIKKSDGQNNRKPQIPCHHDNIEKLAVGKNNENPQTKRGEDMQNGSENGKNDYLGREAKTSEDSVTDE
ncbi:hypothetical protein ACLOJK_012083 [Asimina triloba]